MSLVLDLLPLGELAIQAYLRRFVQTPVGIAYVKPGSQTGLPVSPDEATMLQTRCRDRFETIERTQIMFSAFNLLAMLGALIVGWFLFALIGLLSLMLPCMFLILAWPLLASVVRVWLAWREVTAEADVLLVGRSPLPAQIIARQIRHNPFQRALPWCVALSLGMMAGLYLVRANSPAAPQPDFTIEMLWLVLIVGLFLLVLLSISHDRMGKR
jgi:hypothetical protein